MPSGDSTTDKIPDVTHVSKPATVRNNVMFRRINYIANTARKKESIIRIPTVSASLIKQPRKENQTKRIEDPVPKMAPKQTRLRNPHQREIPHHAEMMRMMISEMTVTEHNSSTQKARMKKNWRTI